MSSAASWLGGSPPQPADPNASEHLGRSEPRHSGTGVASEVGRWDRLPTDDHRSARDGPLGWEKLRSARGRWPGSRSPATSPLSPPYRKGSPMGFIKARGRDLYYEEKGDGPPILLIPPSGATASTWGALADDLSRVGRVVAYDRSGYSRSKGETVRSASEHTTDATAVLEALRATPAVVVGTSAGATIALDLAVRRPDLVRAVVAHESPWRALRHPTASGLGALARMSWLAWRGRYADAADVLLRTVYAYRDGGSAWDAFPEEWRRTARENGRSVIADLRSTMGDYPRRTDLATITSPVVCTYGSRSAGYMRRITRSLARAIPAARVCEIDGAAHAVAFDAPGAFAQVIVEAIQSSEFHSGT